MNLMNIMNIHIMIHIDILVMNLKKRKSSAKIILKQYSSYLLSEAAKTLTCCFPVNFAKFLRTPFLQNTTERLFLFFDDVIQTKF